MEDLQRAADEARERVSNYTEEQKQALTQKARELVGPSTIHIQTESTVPQLNSVLQVIKGPHRGRLCQVGRIDRDTFHCFIVTRDNGRDFIDVKPDEYILVAHSKKGMTGLKEPLDAQSVTPQATEDSPFAGFKG